MNVGALTKADMVEFYKHYVDPSSAHCAKLVVNFNSQVKATAETNGNPLATPNDPDATDTDAIKKHLQLKLKVNKTELEDGVELWREVCMQNQNTEEIEAIGMENDRVINIDDLDAFKASLDALDPPRLDLSKFEWQG